MEHKLKIYRDLATLFDSKGFLLYLVGGTVRDYLLGKELTDMDLVTDATPSEMKEFLSNADYTFEKYGSVRLKIDDIKFDITTLRKEEGYSDFRHPNKICFTKSLKEDVFRRDITINAMYMDKDLNVIDFVGGQKDISNKVIRMIGKPLKRINEDPLRIIRIYRFKLETGFEIERELNDVLEHNFSKAKLINKDKINQEIRKSTHQEELIELLKYHGII
ncbi:MAG: CCA tRNA nucleotidyltransferase [Bacilli bacterium]|nr:CCA tRNA nucleotidyltransferase [Bacilli bacterium]